MLALARFAFLSVVTLAVLASPAHAAGNRVAAPQYQPVPADGVVWATGAKASSSYDNMRYAPKAATGAPNVFPKYGDLGNAWTGKGRHDQHWIELSFPKTKTAEVRVFETCGPGGITRILDVTSGERVIYEAQPGKAPSYKEAQVLVVTLAPPAEIAKLKIEVNPRQVGEWAQIDAVGLVRPGVATGGARPRAAAPVRGGPAQPTGRWAPAEYEQVARQDVVWATSAKASSSYDNGGQSAKQVTGAPDLYPVYADKPKSWTGKGRRGSHTIELGFPKTKAAEVWIFETFGAGGIERVTDVSSGANVIYEAQPGKQSFKEAQVLHIKLKNATAISKLKIEVNCKRSSQWIKIDAVGLVPPGGTATGGAAPAAGGARPRAAAPVRGGPAQPTGRWAPAEYEQVARQDVVWATSAKASSSYDNGGQSAKQVTGAPDLYPVYADKPKSWTGKGRRGSHTIELGFPKTKAAEVWIFETFGAGGIERVTNVSSGANVIYEAQPGKQSFKEAQVLHIKLKNATAISKLKIEVNCKRSSQWIKIDAVGLVPPGGTATGGAAPAAGGARPRAAAPVRGGPAQPTGRWAPAEYEQVARQDVVWATSAKASSSYDNGGQSAKQVTGAPDLYPVYADKPKSWTGKGRRGSHTIELGFPKTKAAEVWIFETFGAGGIERVTNVSSGANVIYEAQPGKQSFKEAQVLHIKLKNATAISKLKIEVNCKRSSQWIKIDAVGLVPPGGGATTGGTATGGAAPAADVPKRPGATTAGGAGATAPATPRAADPATPRAADPVKPRAADPVKPRAADPPKPSAAGPAKPRAVQPAGRWAPAGYEKVARPDVVWATSARASSSYNSSGYAAEQATGAPNLFPKYGDLGNAWTGKGRRGTHTLELTFPETAASQVWIFETWGAGGIARVTDLSSGDRVIYEAPRGKQSFEEAQVLHINLPDGSTISRLKIEVDTQRSKQWIQIDAVGLVPSGPAAAPRTAPATGRWPATAYTGGARQDVVWATSARASSSYNSAGYAAKQATGAPNLFPKYGDLGNAWTGKGRSGIHTLELSFPKTVASQVWIFETWGAGGIARVTDLSSGERVIYEAPAGKASFTVAQVLHIRLPQGSTVSRLRIEVDPMRSDQWIQIDAVGLVP